MRALFLVLLLALPLPSRADTFRLPENPETADFVTANLIATFYHEVAHALIDVMDLPVLGREEDAADTLSVLLIDRFWEEDAAAAMVTAHALAFLLYAASGEGDDHSYWATHALDMQRYYNLVCLFYGADPEARGDLAADLELPDERRESCPEEWQMASDSWGAMLEGLGPQDQGSGLRMVVPEGRDDYTRIVAAEVAAFNAEFGLPVPVEVAVEPCGEANAFYEPDARRIVMCIEYAEDLALLHESAP